MGSHLAAHYREATGALDASASVSNLRLVEYATDGLVQTFDLDMSSGTVTLDADSSLGDRLVALAERAGAHVLGVFEWRLSDRTRKANAALAEAVALFRAMDMSSWLARAEAELATRAT